jgi:hypothetical protein
MGKRLHYSAFKPAGFGKGHFGINLRQTQLAADFRQVNHITDPGLQRALRAVNCSAVDHDGWKILLEQQISFKRRIESPQMTETSG